MKLQKKSGSELYWKIIQFFHVILFKVGLRRPRPNWGIVFDSYSKQPLDPALVTLAYADGSPAEVCITDLQGRYGFLARPGKFKIFVRKANFKFPSIFESGKSDGVYTNLYHGEFFELHNDAEVIAPNIPLDPVNPDWNQQAKKEMFKTYFYRNLFFGKMIKIIFWFGFIFVSLGWWQEIQRGRGGLDLIIIPASILYGAAFLLSLVLPEPRLWGQIISTVSKREFPSLVLELSNPIIPGVIMGKGHITDGGRFLMRAQPGSYVLTLKSGKDHASLHTIGSVPVTVNNDGVVNVTLVII